MRTRIHQRSVSHTFREESWPDRWYRMTGKKPDKDLAARRLKEVLTGGAVVKKLRAVG